DRLARRGRLARTAPARSTPSTGHQYAAQVVSTRCRRRAAPARVVDLPRARPCHRHVLVSDRDAQAAALRAEAGGALQARATAMNAPSTLPTLVQAFFMDRLMQQRQAS